jgi:hypothetical protein
MILVGQYDSPFVRQVAVALHFYAMPFERRIQPTLSLRLAQRFVREYALALSFCNWLPRTPAMTVI